MKLVALRTDAYEDGMADGRADERDAMIRNMLTEKLSLDMIARISKAPLEYVQSLSQTVTNAATSL